MKLSALLELMLKQLGCKKIMKKKPTVKAICYRDLKQDGYDNTYELTNKPGKLQIKEQIIKGEFDYPDMYIRHLSLTLTTGGRIPIVSYTDYELSPEKGLEIIAGAFKLLSENE